MNNMINFKERLKYKNYTDSQKHILLTIFENFNYEKVHNCMVALKWEWLLSSLDFGIPSVEDIKISTIHYMCNVMDKAIENPEKDYSVSTGGFEYSHLGDFNFSMKFVLTDWEWCELDSDCDTEYQRIKKIENLKI